MRGKTARVLTTLLLQRPFPIPMLPWAEKIVRSNLAVGGYSAEVRRDRSDRFKAGGTVAPMGLQSQLAINVLPLTCSVVQVQNQTEPRTVGQWIRYFVVAVIALFLVWWMLRLYVL